MEVIRLTLEDCRLLETRFTEYDNSHLRFEEALIAAGVHPDEAPAAAADQDCAPTESEPDPTAAPESGTNTVARLRALRRLECHSSIDLGSLYHRYQHRDDPGIHPLERSILDSIAHWHHDPAGTIELWVLVDNVRQVRELIDAERAEWLEPARS